MGNDIGTARKTTPIARHFFTALTGLAASVSAVSAQAQESEDSTLTVEPLLPEEGLLRSETWTALGQQLLANVVDYAPRVVAALVVFAVFLVLSRVAARLVKGVLGRTASDPALGGILSRVAFYTLLVLGLVMAIAQAGIAIGPLLAGASVFGLAVGLAAQDSLGNLVAGLTILWDRPFRLGDRVTVGDTYGEVTSISIRTTTVRTPGHRELIIPNRDVIDGVIINHSRTSELRLDVPVGIGYAEDIDRARKVLLAAADESDFVDPERGSDVVVTALGDSSVDLQLRTWLADPATERPALHELTEKAKKALDEADIEIPFPQRVLHLESTSSEPIAIHQISEAS